jgi:hypothetical protein
MEMSCLYATNKINLHITMFKIDLEGLKELQKALGDYKHSIEPNTLNASMISIGIITCPASTILSMPVFR